MTNGSVLALSTAFWEWERFVMQVVFLVIFFLLIRGVKNILAQAQSDRQARELAIEDVRRAADVLSQRTDALAGARETATTEAAGMISRRLDGIDSAIETNTAVTTRAAEASAEAAHVANSMNKKIDATNERLLEHVEHKGPE